ncbi:MAG: AI-2E family transporter [Pseudonocardia sp.]
MTETAPGDPSEDVPAASSADSAPAAMPRGLVVVLGLTGLLVSTLALKQFSAIVAPVLLALILMIGVHPLTGILRRRGVPQWLAASITLVTVLGIVLGLAASLALSVVRLGAILPQYEESFTALVNDLRATLEKLGLSQQELHDMIGQIDFGQLAGLLTGLLSSLAGAFTNLLFLLFVVVFMGVDAVGFSRRLQKVGGTRTAVVAALGGFVRGTRTYLIVSTVFGLIVAVIDTVFLWAVGVPLAVLWGLLAFVTNYIPNVGFIIGLLPPAVLALLEGGPRLMIIVIVAYSAINFVIQSLIQPKFVGDAVNLLLTLTFVSLVFWSFVIGPLGAILAIPLTLLAKALLLDVDPQTRWISELMSGGQNETTPDPQDGPPADRPAGIPPDPPPRSDVATT